MSGEVLYIRNIAIMATLFTASNIDLRERRIPNITVIAMFLYGLLDITYVLVAEHGITDLSKEVLFSKGLGFIVAISICVISRLVSKEGLGAGDIKMLAALGFTLGISLFLRMMVFTAVSAVILTLIMMSLRKIDRTSSLPFAPYMTLGLCAAFLIDSISR